MKLIKVVAKFGVVLLILFAIFMFGAYQGITNKNFIGDLKDFIFSAPTYLSNSINADSDTLDCLSINIEDPEYKKIKNVRSKSIEKNALRKDINVFSKASFNFQDEEFNGEMMLKGIFKDHWISEDERWSYKVKLEKGQSLYESSFFSMMKPERREFLWDWYYDELLNYSGLIYQRQNFVKVDINKINLGIYVLEERFCEDYLKREGMKGVIFRLDKSDLVKSDEFVLEYDQWMSRAKLKIICASDPKHTKKALKLFDQVRFGDIAPKEAFDMKIYASLTTLSILSGSWHPMMPHNNYYFYNAKSGKIEVVGDDGGFTTKTNYNHTYMRPIDNIVCKDTLFYNEYYKKLKNIVEIGFVDSFIEKSRINLKNAEKIIHDESPAYNQNFEWILKENEKKIKYLLKKNQGVRAYCPILNDSLWDVDITLPIDFPVQITCAFDINERLLEVVGNSVVYNEHLGRLKSRKVQFRSNGERIVKIGYRIIGSDSIQFILPEPYSRD